MKTKKGIVLPETLKIIIAVMCILLLLYLAFKLYDIFRRSNELEQAKATLEAIVGKANSLKEGESTEYLITGPRGWVLLSYNEGIGTCNEKCLCICPNLGWFSNINYINLCKKQGVCKSSLNTKEIILEEQTMAVSRAKTDKIVFDKIPAILSIISTQTNVILSSIEKSAFAQQNIQDASKIQVKQDSGESVTLENFIKSKITDCSEDFEFSEEDKNLISESLKKFYNKDIHECIRVIKKIGNFKRALVSDVAFCDGIRGLPKELELCQKDNVRMYLEIDYKT
jgi:hypothetical protein